MKNFVKFFEIPATDVHRAIKFYQLVFNIEIELCEFGNEKMGMFPEKVGSISQSEGFKPCDQGVLITLNGGNNLDDKLSIVNKNGGSTIIKKTKIGADEFGYFAVFKDTEGNRIGLYSDN